MTRQDFARAIRGQRKLDAETKTAGSFTLAKKTRRNKSGVVDDEDDEEWEEDDKDEDEDRSRSKQRQGPVMPNDEVLHPLSHEYQARQKMAKQRSEEKVRRLELKHTAAASGATTAAASGATTAAAGAGATTASGATPAAAGKVELLPQAKSNLLPKAKSKYGYYVRQCYEPEDKSTQKRRRMVLAEDVLMSH